jgi:hypothetical protein
VDCQVTNDLTYTGSDGWPLNAHAMGYGPLLVMLHGGARITAACNPSPSA